MTLTSNKSTLDFFIPYSAAYILFLSVTILVAVVFAIVWGNYARSHDTWASRRYSSLRAQRTRHCCNAILMFSFEASAALLTWTGSIYSTTYHQGNMEGPIMGLPGILVGTLLLWIPLVTLTDFLYIRGASSPRTVCVLLCVFLITLLCVIPGFTMLTVYCKQMASIESYTYYGPMIVTTADLTVESLQMRGRFSRLRSNEKVAYIHFAKPTVHWGFNWGCPEQPITWCSSTLYEPDCVRCEGRMKEQGFACLKMGTKDDAKQCVMNKYAMALQRPDNGDPAFSSLVHPPAEWEHDSPSARSTPQYLYGSCQTCNVLGPNSFNFLIRHNKSLKNTGIGLEVFALCTYSGLLLWVVVSQQLEKNHGDTSAGEESSGTEQQPEPGSVSHNEETTREEQDCDREVDPADADTPQGTNL